MTQMISVVVPVHGDAPFLAESLASIEKQTFQGFDLLIILDRPSDNTRSFVESLAKSDLKATILESARPGISAALNLGISASESKYIARLDADDLMQPTRLEVQMTTLEKTPNITCLGSQAEYIDDRGKTIGRSNLPTSAWQIKSMMPTLNCLVHPSVMIRKSAFVSVGGYREYLDGVEDYNLWLRLLSVGSIQNCKEYLTIYRRHSAQSTQANSSINPWLDSIARLDALGYEAPIVSTKWSVYLKSLPPEQLESRIRELESATTGPWIRKRLQSSRSFSLYFTGPRKHRLQNITSSFIGTPLRTFWLAILVLALKIKSL